MRNEEQIETVLTVRMSHALKRKIKEYCKARTKQEFFNYTPSVLVRIACMNEMLAHPIKEGENVEPKPIDEEIRKLETGD